MNNPTFEQILYWLTGMVGMPLIQWLKTQFGLKGQAALWLAFGVSIILASAALFFNGELRVDDITPAAALSALGQVLAAATLAYKLLLADAAQPDALGKLR